MVQESELCSRAFEQVGSAVRTTLCIFSRFLAAAASSLSSVHFADIAFASHVCAAAAAAAAGGIGATSLSLDDKRSDYLEGQKRK